MFKLYLLYRKPEPGQFFKEAHYHQVHLATALEFVGKYRCRRLELGKALDLPDRGSRRSEWYRTTELFFDTLEDAVACVYSPEMLGLNPDGANYHSVSTASGFYETEEYDFGPDQRLASAAGIWADFFEPRIGQAGLGLPPGSPNPIVPPRAGAPGASRPGRPGFHGALADGPSARPVKTLLLYRPVGDGNFFDEDHYHRIHLATGLEFLGKFGCRRLELGRSVDLPERQRRPAEWFRYTSLYFDSLEAAQSGAPTPEMRELSKDEKNYHNVPQSSGWFEREVYTFDDGGRLASATGDWAEYFADSIGSIGQGLPAGVVGSVPPRPGGPDVADAAG